jgi:hypothetical protein
MHTVAPVDHLAPPAGGPSVEDALRLLTEPGNCSMRVDPGMVQMRPATIGALEAMGADRERAVALIAEAAERLGGWMRLEIVGSRPLGLGRWDPGRWHETISVPEDALRRAAD